MMAGIPTTRTTLVKGLKLLIAPTVRHSADLSTHYELNCCR